MDKKSLISLFLLRISLGWLFFYAGITKILDNNWSAFGYLNSAKTFVVFYKWLASPQVLPVVNFLNKWGLTLIGLSLILGIFTKLSSLFGTILMFLYYLPIIQFPYPNKQSFIVDEHIIYLLSLITILTLKAGRFYGLDSVLARNFYIKHHKIAKFLA